MEIGQMLVEEGEGGEEEGLERNREIEVKDLE